MVATLSINTAQIVRNVIELFWTLVERGADISRARRDGYTFAHLAATRDDIEMLQVYVTQGGDVDAFSSTYSRPLYLALCHVNLDALCFLLQLGAHIDAVIGEGDTVFEQMRSKVGLSVTSRSLVQ